MLEADVAGGKERPLRELLAKALGAVTLVFALLQFWRPCYCLTDDNLDGNLPLLAGIGRRMLHGESPFLCPYLYGGNYDLLHDPSGFFWHPIYLVAGLIANSPAWFLTIDFIAYFFVMVGAAGFVCQAHFLRLELKLKLSDGRLILYTLSFSFSMIALCYASSWINFFADYTAMPWLALGILQTTCRRGLGIVSLFSLHDLLGGHPETVVITAFFSTLFAGGVAWWRGSYRPLLWWFGGYAIALVVIAPLLVPTVEGFFISDRSKGLDVGTMNQFAVPARLFPFSLFLSTFSARLHIPYQFALCPRGFVSGFVSCAAAWALIPALVSRWRWSRLEILSLAIMVLAAVLIIRPGAVSEVMIHVPVLKSMRWPFREIGEFEFFLHLFLILRPMDVSVWFQRGLIGLGVCLYLLPLPFLSPPTFNAMGVDRGLLLSGRAQRYWEQVRPLLAPDDVLVPMVNPYIIKSGGAFKLPLCLIDSGSYPAWFQARSATGYSATVPSNQLYLQTPIMIFWGVFYTPQEDQILAERPNVRFITLESLDPLWITLSTKTGPPLDLTPYLPPPSR